MKRAVVNAVVAALMGMVLMPSSVAQTRGKHYEIDGKMLKLARLSMDKETRKMMKTLDVSSMSFDDMSECSDEERNSFLSELKEKYSQSPYQKVEAPGETDTTGLMFVRLEDGYVEEAVLMDLVQGLVLDFRCHVLQERLESLFDEDR